MFPNLKEYLDALNGRFGVPAWDALVCRAHRPLFRRMYGDGICGREVWWQYSVTKLFTVTAALQLWQEGKLSLDDPVSWYLPEYAQLSVKTRTGLVPAEATLTIRHLFIMTSGYSYSAADPALRGLSREGKNREIAIALSRVPLAFEPGEHFLYGWSLDILAAVCEVITGQSFAAFLKERIFDPLEIFDWGFHLSDTKGKLPTQYLYDFRKKCFTVGAPENFARLTQGHESGGGGIFTTVEGTAKLMDALACGGTAVNGARLLEPETIEMLRKNALNRVQMQDFAAIGTVKPGYGYGLGVRTLVDQTKSPGSLGEFGWSGAGGGYVLVDPALKLSLVYSQQVLNFMPAFDEIHNGLRDALYADVQQGAIPH